jgi:hypothetical protein
VERVSVHITTEGGFRATEIMADLRNVAKTLYHPLRPISFWDVTADNAHLCPYQNRGQECLHLLPRDDPRRVAYAATVEDQMDGIVEVYFPHAQVYIYLK